MLHWFYENVYNEMNQDQSNTLSNPVGINIVVNRRNNFKIAEIQTKKPSHQNTLPRENMAF